MSEIRALLLTDVIDSTRMSEEIGDEAMAAVWTQHDRVARDLLPVWHGREIDKTDGMLLLFEDADNALQYARAYHAAIAALPMPLQARAGLHVGSVVLRENSAADVARGAKPLEVDGLVKPVAARIMAIAQAGQTLFSRDAHASLGNVLAGQEVESHGHWIVKGVAEPIEIFELATPDAPLSRPPDGEKAYQVTRSGERWLAVREIPNNLPQQSSSFVGRDQELREIKALLGSSRLVTLLGMGGLGKTRLSLQAAAELMHRFPDGVWFLDLSPITDPALALAEAAQVLGVRPEPDRTLLQSVCAYLKTRHVLMVFDNCEHLVKASAELAHAIVKAAPHVRLAASSREALRIPGERTYPVRPLPVPRAGDTLAALQQSTAVRLFVERAQAMRADFELTEAAAPAVIELVSRLEGIPLALELAAARVRSLSVADINRRLSDRYKLLTGGSRVLQSRQQTLRALVDWSYDMLQDEERTLLMRLAAFRGGFDMQAAEAVCGTDPLEADDVLDLVASLVEKSLVMLEPGEAESRYRMLETIREYAHEKLRDSGESPVVAAAHCTYFFGLAKQGRDGLRGPQQGEWLVRLETEQDNLRAATTTALAGEGGTDPVVALKLAVALQNFWILRGNAMEGRALMRTLLALPAVQANEAARAHALYLSATLAWSQSDHAAALEALDDCLRVRRALDNPVELAATLSTLALARVGVGDADGARTADLEALALFQQAEHVIGEATVRLQLGQIEFYLGQDAAALAHLQAALAMARDVEHPETEAEVEWMLGQYAYETGDLAGAARHLAHSLQVCLAAGDRRGAAHALWWQAKLDLHVGELAPAAGRLADALMAFNAFEMRDPFVGCLEDCAVLALARDEAGTAIDLAGAAYRLREQLRLGRSARAQARWDALHARLHALMDATEFDTRWQEAITLETTASLRQALNLCREAGGGA